MDSRCIVGFAFLTTGFLGLAAMFLNYKAKFEKDKITLQKNDQKQTRNDQEHQERIKKLEEKNGYGQKQIDELKKGNGELKDLVIKLQDRIINCEKNGNHKKRYKDLGEEEN